MNPNASSTMMPRPLRVVAPVDNSDLRTSHASLHEMNDLVDSVEETTTPSRSNGRQSSITSSAFLNLFTTTMDPERLRRVLDDQANIASGQRYGDYLTINRSSQHSYEDHTNETIFGMDLHSLREGELVNDAMIGAFTKLAFAASPYWESRRFITPYLSKQIEIQPEKYGRRDVVVRNSNHGGDTTNAAPWLPTDDSEIILVPYNRSLHWTVAALISSSEGQLRLHQNSLHSDFGHHDALSNILRRCELIPKGAKLEHFPGPKQTDGHNCGVAVCLAMYIWLLHPTPLQFDWSTLQRISPDILDAFRNYILYVVATGEIHNIFYQELDYNGFPVSMLSEDLHQTQEQDSLTQEESGMDIDVWEEMDIVSISSDRNGDDIASADEPRSMRRHFAIDQMREKPALYRRPFAYMYQPRAWGIMDNDDAFYQRRHTEHKQEDPFDVYTSDPFDLFFSRRRRGERGAFPLIL